MLRSILRDLVILLGVFGLIWLVFTLFSFPEDPQLMSVEKEERLGDVYTDLILLNPMFEPLENTMIDSAVRVIGDRLLEGLHHISFYSPFLNS